MHKLPVAVCIVLAATVGVSGARAALPDAAPRGEVVADWIAQDGGADAKRCFTATRGATLEEGMVELVLREVDKDAAAALRGELTRLRDSGAAGRDRRWRDLYVRACEARRARRLAPLLAHCKRIVFTKHHTFPSSNVFYTEGLSDAQNQRNFKPDAALCVLEMDGVYGKVRGLLADREGVIRDPDVSYDGKRILFAWKKSRLKDDYHLYEMQVATGKARRLTGGLGFADYEPAYLPNGQIVFNSTRCIQTVDCNFTEVSNLYMCDGDGRFMRRIGFDQVHTTSPAVTEDGRIVYTRWDYNDRGQVYPQPLFQMNIDGTAQTECYGNNSWFPTTIQFARGIPGTGKLLAILPGHHTRQAGELAIIDPSKGRQENAGVQLIAPVRETKPIRKDGYGQAGDLFQYPYPITETQFLVTYAPQGWARPLFGIYFMDVDGRRELLAWDAAVPCNQPVPLRARKRPKVRPSVVDYRKTTGVFTVQDVYAGPGLAGIRRGAAKRIRVVALEFRAAGIGRNRNQGPAGRATVSSPIAIDNGSWDVKHVLGSTTIETDGSASFIAPARRPLYFQVLDASDHVIQTMRSWSTLQPGETFACVGCHEDKNYAPALGTVTVASKRGPRKLDPFYGPARGFSFAREIQPILDKHCIRCHNRKEVVKPSKGGKHPPFSLSSQPNRDGRAKRVWSDAYLALTRRGKSSPRVNWISPQSAPPMLPPYHAGAARSTLMSMLAKGHVPASPAETPAKPRVKLSREELAKIACWIDLLVPFCGDYREANTWTSAERQKYDHFEAKRKRMETFDRRNIAQLLAVQADRPPTDLPPVPAFVPIDALR